MPQEFADKIILESWYQFSPNLMYTQAAQLLLQTDTFLNNGLYSEAICTVLDARGLHSCYANSITQLDVEHLISLHNTDLFAQGGICFLNIQSSEPVQVYVHDVFGRTVKTFKINDSNLNKTVFIDAQHLATGQYIASVYLNHRMAQSFVLVKVE